jgi:leucyl-tRNA synthetase
LIKHNLLSKYLPIIEVIEGGEVQKYAYTGEGKHINSGELDGLENEAAISKATPITLPTK